MSENGEIYTAGKNFTLPPAVTGVTNSTSAPTTIASVCAACEVLSNQTRISIIPKTEVEFVHDVSAGGSVKFVASGVNFSIFTHFVCFFLLKMLKLGELDGVKFLT